MASNPRKAFRLDRFFNLKILMITSGVLLLGWLIAPLALNAEQQVLFLPGQTSEGHFLFEASCFSCHEGFHPVSNETCLRCHQAEMAEDKHGPKKFRDPRYAAELEKLEVLTCTTCHNEHVPVDGRGVHLQPNLCMTCHADTINPEAVNGFLKSHEGFSPTGCWAAGCHNFHDQRSISTGFLYDNLDQPPLLPIQKMLKRTVLLKLQTAPKPDLNQERWGGTT